MSIEEAKKLDLGAILDFCNEWNEVHSIEEEENSGKPKIRDATQEDIDRFLG